MRVLFVCSGNICRSPMAAEYMRHRVAGEGMGHVVVESAGLLGIEGAPASPEAIRALEEAGLDLRGHRSRGVSGRLLRGADLIVAMSSDHLELIDRIDPGTEARRLLLRAFEAAPVPANGAADLDDPMGSPIEVYRDRFETIRTCVDHLVLHLKHTR